MKTYLRRFDTEAFLTGIAIVAIALTACAKRRPLSSNMSLDETLSVVAVTPAYGPMSGSTELSISGTGFKTGMVIQVGDSTCTSPRVISAFQAYCIAPASAQAVVVDVNVLNPDGDRAALTRGYRYNTAGGGTNTVTTLQITSVSPDNGPANGNTEITITGTNFPTSDLLVSLGSDFCSNVQYVSTTQLKCRTPSSVGGKVNLTVLGANSNSDVLEAAFTYSPVAAAVTPQASYVSGNMPIVVTGVGFVAGAKVYIGDVACPISALQHDRIACTTAPATAGTYNLRVVNPEGLESVLVNSFRYDPVPTSQTPPPPAAPVQVPAPVFAAKSESAGPLGGGQAITIAGANFVPGATVVFGSSPCAVSALTANSISCTTGPGAGNVGVVIRNPDGQAVSGGGYAYTPPPVVDLLIDGRRDDLIRGADDLIVVAWSSANASYCEVTREHAPGDKWIAPAHPGIGVEPFSVFAEMPTRYWLSCWGPGGFNQATRYVHRYIKAVGGPAQAAFLMRNDAEIAACLQRARSTPSCSGGNASYLRSGTVNAAQYGFPSGRNGYFPVQQCRCAANQGYSWWTKGSTPRN